MLWVTMSRSSNRPQRVGRVGAGILLQPSGQRILERLGVLNAVTARAARLDGLEAKLANDRVLVRLRHSHRGDNVYGLGVHRGLLFEQLLGLAQATGVRLVTGARIVAYNVGSTVDVVTEDGTSHTGFSFLVATDGSRSAMRAAASIPHKTVEYPYAALWTTGINTQVSDRLLQIVDGTKRLVGLLPIGEGRCSFFWGVRADQREALFARGLSPWKSEVVTLCPLAGETLEEIDSFDQLTFATYRHVKMRRWYGPGIVFLGDAAHPSSPHLAQGVNLALEDAVCFADALQQFGDFDRAAVEFGRRRAAKLRYYQQLTRLLTPFFQSDIPLLAAGRNACLPWMPHVPWVRTQMIRTLCGDQTGWFR